MIRAEAELKGGTIGEPDDWLGTTDDGSGFIHSVLNAVLHAVIDSNLRV